jgi:hypothetical protein
MASLSGATIATTFKSLLKLAGNTDDLAAGGSTAIQVMTGDGENTPIYLNTNRVGIGTNAPAKALHISGAGEKGILITSTDNDTVLELAAATTEGQNSNLIFSCGASGSKGTILYDHHAAPATQKMQFKVGDNNVTAATILGDGKVGIGTAAPGLLAGSYASSQYLTIANTSGDYFPILELAGNRGGTGNQTGQISFWNLSGTDTEVAKIICLGSGTNAQEGELVFYTNGGSLSEQMRIDEDGKVGIGTDAPDAPLEIKGVNQAAWAGADANASLKIVSGNAATDGLFFGIDTNSRAWIQSADSNTLSTERDLYLQPAGGKVGIGTAAPGNLLNIEASSGEIHGEIESISLADTQASTWFAKGKKSGGTSRYSQVGVMYNDAVAQAAGFLRFDSHDGVTAYIWLSSTTDIIRASSTITNVGADSAGVALGADITSDERLKNISSDVFPYGLTEVNKLVPIKYSLKKDGTNKQSLGFGGQTTKPIIPEAVNDTNECIDGYTWKVDENDKQTEQVANSSGKATKLSMSYMQIIPVLVKAVQELSAKVTALEGEDSSSDTKIAALEAKDTASEAKIVALEAEDTANKAKVATLETEDVANKAKITALETKDAEYATTIAALTARITALESA